MDLSLISKQISGMHPEDPDLNFEPQEGMRVFKKSKDSHETGFTANTVVEFPIDPRVWLAGMAMQGLIVAKHLLSINPGVVAQEAVEYADALLKQLNKLN